MFSGTINNILGEVLWHSITVDPTIETVSKAHCDAIEHLIEKHGAHLRKPGRPFRILEVAAYAHTTGYMLANKHDVEVTLSDISVDTLALGRQAAIDSNLDNEKVRRVASDFHDLPFPDGYFDVVYIASALHHTWSWQAVLKELMRTVKPEGLLYLENEPCAREFCFYNFRTNRREQFREIEKSLDQEGLLNTVAEPFPGSRPEELFGMVENQTMALDEMLHILRAAGTIESLELSPESCMSEFDTTLFNHREHSKAVVEQLIFEKLTTSIEKVGATLSEIDKKIGYQLPSQSEAEEMAGTVAESITQIERNVPLDGESVRVAISNIFGASVTIVAKKGGTLQETAPDTANLRYKWGERSGVTIAYPENVQKVLESTIDLLPDIQRATSQKVAESFSPAQWTTHVGDNGLRSLFPSPSAIIRCSDTAGRNKFLIMLRIYAVYDSEPFKVTVNLGDKEIGCLEIYQTDTYLLRSEFESTDSNIELSLNYEYVNARHSQKAKPIVLNVSAARVCA